MDVQGSGYIDFSDGSPQLFSYAGKNGHAYRSIGKVLIDRGEVKRRYVDAGDSSLGRNTQ